MHVSRVPICGPLSSCSDVVGSAPNKHQLLCLAYGGDDAGDLGAAHLNCSEGVVIGRTLHAREPGRQLEEGRKGSPHGVALFTCFSATTAVPSTPDRLLQRAWTARYHKRGRRERYERSLNCPGNELSRPPSSRNPKARGSADFRTRACLRFCALSRPRERGKRAQQAAGPSGRRVRASRPLLFHRLRAKARSDP